MNEKEYEQRCVRMARVARQTLVTALEDIKEKLEGDVIILYMPEKVKTKTKKQVISMATVEPEEMSEIFDSFSLDSYFSNDEEGEDA